MSDMLRTKKVEVAVHATYSSGIPAKMIVTLPASPWDEGQEEPKPPEPKKLKREPYRQFREMKK